MARCEGDSRLRVTTGASLAELIRWRVRTRKLQRPCIDNLKERQALTRPHSTSASIPYRRLNYSSSAGWVPHAHPRSHRAPPGTRRIGASSGMRLTAPQLLVPSEPTRRRARVVSGKLGLRDGPPPSPGPGRFKGRGAGETRAWDPSSSPADARVCGFDAVVRRASAPRAGWAMPS
jgi:hypothetical protein